MVAHAQTQHQFIVARTRAIKAVPGVLAVEMVHGEEGARCAKLELNALAARCMGSSCFATLSAQSDRTRAAILWSERW
jgi:hypothetical protein